ncbi:MAG: hypothetical protein F6K64_32895 [Moorea sp. SIO3A2]|nr:hypothetical protein [Moorena sp. SIO3A2]
MDYPIIYLGIRQLCHFMAVLNGFGESGVGSRGKRSAVSGQRSVVSRQPSAVSGQPLAFS